MIMDTSRAQLEPDDAPSNDDDDDDGVEEMDARMEKRAVACLKSLQRRASSAAKMDAGSDRAVEPAQPRKPRGRPKKETSATPVTPSFKKNGRSKTGCQTCRNRKKKCDELKPICAYSVESERVIISFRHMQVMRED